MDSVVDNANATVTGIGDKLSETPAAASQYLQTANWQFMMVITMI